MDSLEDNLERDVNACLMFLMANQDKWDVEAPIEKVPGIGGRTWTTRLANSMRRLRRG